MLRADLERVRERIARGWTQGAYSRDVAGTDKPYPHEKEAVCWCLGGAAQAVAGTFDNFEPERQLASALGFPDSSVMQHWNDREGRTKAEVLARIDDAIASCAEGAK